MSFKLGIAKRSEPAQAIISTKMNSETGVLKYSESHRSGGRIARLSYEISKTVIIDNDQDKEKISNKKFNDVTESKL